MVQVLNKKHIYILNRIAAFVIPMLVFMLSFLMLESIVGSQSFKHDEAVYLTKARSWIENTPADEWRIYRPIGSATAAWFILQFTSSEMGVRMLTVALGALSLTFIYLLFKSISNAWVALSIALMAGLSPVFLEQSPQFLNDIPAAGLLIGALWLIWEHNKSDGKSKTIYLASLFAALSLYLRYGVAIALGATALSTVLILMPQFSKRENTNYFNFVITAVIFILLLAPHLIQAFQSEGSPVGILMRAGDASHRPEYLGEAFLDYKNLLASDKLGGKVIDIFAILGVFVTPIILLFKKLRQRFEALPWLGVIALIVFVLTSLSTHAETRFIFTSLVLLAGVGVMGIYLLIQNRLKLVANLLIVPLLMLATVYYGINYYKDANEYFRWTESNLLRNIQTEASLRIAIDSNSGKGCLVWAATARPEISWYSKCNTLGIVDVDRFERDYLIHLRKSHYTIAFTGLSGTQITPETQMSLECNLLKYITPRNCLRLMVN